MENKRTQQRILDNALQHFCSFGYNGTSVREITAASEVTKPTLYYYFKNKEELFTKLAENCFNLVLTKLDECLQRETTYENSLRSFFNCMDQVVAQNPAALKFIHSVIVAPQRGSPDVGAMNFSKSIDERLTTIIERAVGTGECMTEKVEMMRLLFLSLLGYHIRTTVTAIYGPTNPKVFDFALRSLVTCSANKGCIRA